MSDLIQTWRVVQNIDTNQLEAALNELSRDGFTIYAVERTTISEHGSESSQQWLPAQNSNIAAVDTSKPVSSTHSKWFGHKWVIVALRVDN